jgi:AcrR family transcriptional regulator
MAKVSREAIIHAATQLFNQNGYHATSMHDVARELGIKKPSLYHHFASKEAILLAILESGMDRLICEIEVISSSEQNCAAKLRAAIRSHAAAIASNPPAAAVFLREDRGLGPEYLTLYVTKRDQFEGFVRGIIQEGVNRGEFQTTDVSIAAEALLGMVNWMTRWYRAEGRLSAEQIADLFADLFLRGLSSNS